MIDGYSSEYFLTFKQAKSKGGSVKKGSKGYQVLKFNPPVLDENDKVIRPPWWKVYTVFNLDQCENIEIPESKTHDLDFNPIDSCEEFSNNYLLSAKGPVLKFGGNVARYIPSKDTIQLPNKEQFLSVERYYKTLFHEIGHSTGHESRLSREGITDISMRNIHQYSYEELIAEFSAAMLCGLTGISNESLIENSASYIDNWLSYLKKDPQKLVDAVSEASKAVDFILNFEEQKTAINN